MHFLEFPVIHFLEIFVSFPEEGRRNEIETVRKLDIELFRFRVASVCVLLTGADVDVTSGTGLI